MKKYITAILIAMTLLFSLTNLSAFAEDPASDPEIVYEGIDFESDIVYKTHFDAPDITVENETDYEIYRAWHRQNTRSSMIVKLKKDSPAKITVDYGVIGTLNNRNIHLKLKIEDMVWANNSRTVSTSSEYTKDEKLIYFGDDPATGYLVLNIYLHKATYSLTYDDGTSLVDPIITYGSLNNLGGPREGNKPIDATKISMPVPTAMKEIELQPCVFTIPDTGLSQKDKQKWYYGYSGLLSEVDDYVYNPLTGKNDAYNPMVAISAFYTDSSNMGVYVTSTGGNIWQNSFFIAKAPTHDLTIKKETNVPNDSTEFDFQLKIWKEHVTEIIEEIEYPYPEGEAYAVFDSSTETLTFFRDDAGKYTTGQTDGTKTYYADFEKTEVTWNNASYNKSIINKFSPWYQILTTQVKKIVFEDEIIPNQTENWFYNMSNLTTIENIQNLKMHNVRAARAMFQGCSSLTELDTSNFYMPKCYLFGSMFRGCSNLEYLDLRGLNFNMFYLASPNDLTGFANMFTDCDKLSADIFIPNMPVNYQGVFLGAATASGAQIRFKTYELTQTEVNILLSQASSGSNVVFGGYVDEPLNNVPDYLDEAEIVHGTDIYVYDLTKDSRLTYDIDTQTYSFSLKAGEELTINDVPKGYFYTVEEVNIPDEYTLISQTNASGAIGDEDIVSTFRNIQYKDILVKKVWDDFDNELETRPEELELTLATDKNTYTSAEPEKSGNAWEYVFTVPSDEIVEEITEDISPDVYEREGGFEELATEDYDEGYTITNKLKRFSLSIEKEVTGNKGDKDKNFEFTVEFFNDSQPYELSSELPDGATGSGGVYTFTLKDGQSKAFENIPTGIQYTITEEDYLEEGYVTSVDGDSGNVVNGEMTEDKNHTYENELNEEESSETTEPSEPTESTEPTEPAEPAEPIEPSEPTKSIDPAETTIPVVPTGDAYTDYYLSIVLFVLSTLCLAASGGHWMYRKRKSR